MRIRLSISIPTLEMGTEECASTISWCVRVECEWTLSDPLRNAEPTRTRDLVIQRQRGYLGADGELVTASGMNARGMEGRTGSDSTENIASLQSDRIYSEKECSHPYSK